MAHLPAPPYLNPSERLEKLASPKVDIYVDEQRKHYSVPVDILCHYSSYFKGHFRSNFREQLDLELEDISTFEAVLEYIISGSTISRLQPLAPDNAYLENYFAFIKFAKNYSISLAGSDLVDNLVKILDSPNIYLESQHIKTVFELFPRNHDVRGLFARAALNAAYKGQMMDNNEPLQHVDGFASEMLRQLRYFGIANKKGRDRNWIPLDARANRSKLI